MPFRGLRCKSGRNGSPAVSWPRASEASRGADLLFSCSRRLSGPNFCQPDIALVRNGECQSVAVASWEILTNLGKKETV
mgnify:CR=1 FL=1